MSVQQHLALTFAHDNIGPHLPICSNIRLPYSLGDEMRTYTSYTDSSVRTLMLGPSELARFLIPSSVCCEGVARMTASDHATASSIVASAARGCSVSNGWYFSEAVFRTPYLLAVMGGAGEGMGRAQHCQA